MPLRFEIKREFSCSSDRVKSLDIHPTEPLIIQSLYTGFVQLWNYKRNRLEKTFEVTQSNSVPVRAVKFITRKQWFVCASDDLKIRIYNYNSTRKIKEWEAHDDYIRCLQVHPSLPLILSGSDDMLIKSWNWEKEFAPETVFRGHAHYVMNLALNPRDHQIFASASLDNTVKVWSLSSGEPRFTLSGHEKGVNCVCYFQENEKPFIVSGGDDHLAKVWDYTSKQCVATLAGHSANISAVQTHALLPLIVTASEDGTLRVWHSRTFRLETTLDYGLDRAWALAASSKGPWIVAGFDFGSVMARMGDERPVASMDLAGNVVWVRNYCVFYANVRRAAEDAADGAPLMLEPVNLGNCDVHPQQLAHSPNGRLLSILGENRLTLCTARNLKSVFFGAAKEFAWSFDSKVCAIHADGSTVKILFECRERRSLAIGFPVEQIYGGTLLGVRSTQFIEFYDWAALKKRARIEFCPKRVVWSQSGSHVALVGKNAVKLLRYEIRGEDDAIFTGEFELSESVSSAKFVGDFCLVYLTEKNELKCHIGVENTKGETDFLHRLEEPFTLLGYLAEKNRLYLIGRETRIISFRLGLQELAFRADVIREDLNSARKRAPQIDEKSHPKIAKFLELRGHFEFALEFSKDQHQIFDLALSTLNFELAVKMAREINQKANWQRLAKRAAKHAEFGIAKECAMKAEEYGVFLLLCVSLGDKTGLEGLAKTARERGMPNIEFLSRMYLSETEEAIGVLVREGRYADASLMARTYSSPRLFELVEKWNEKLKTSFRIELPEGNGGIEIKEGHLINEKSDGLKG